MKRIAASAMAIIAMASCSKSGVEIAGTINNAGGQMIYLSEVDLDRTFIVDSAEVKQDGSFELVAPKNSQPTFYIAQLNDGKNQITILTDSATLGVNLTADMNAETWQKSVKFDNSADNNDINDFIIRIDDLQKDFVALASNVKMPQDERQVATEKFKEKLADHKAVVHKYVFDHPRSFVSYFALFQSVVDMPVFDMRDQNDLILYNTAATSLGLAYPNSDRVKDLCSRVLLVRRAMVQQKKTENLIKDAVVVGSPDLKMKDSEGNVKTLSELKGKIVILQFWASQSDDSRKVNRQLVKLYEKYKSRGLEIYQVSVDTSELLWKNAIKADGLTWTNVCDLQGSGSLAVRLYNISAVPSNYIIDREGTLVGKDLFGTRLDNRMAELFK
ncbi:MAG: AhpC/TSA family protein [Bacteroidales bacterium]|nr:AhpC/TSA family protein [Bacteroidales bacterium]